MNYKVSYSMAPQRPADAFSHATALARLRQMGFAPGSVYDIGAFHGQWSKDATRIFPGANFVQFEANADNEAALAGSGQQFFITALAATDGEERAFYSPKQVIATGASLYRENTGFYADENLVTRKAVTARLDTLAAAHKLEPAQLIKIDVQGAELDVLAGAQETMKHCEALIVETSLLNYNKGAPLFGEVVAAVDRLGLTCVDICEINRIGPGMILQIDLLFVRDTLYQKYYAAAGLL
jgi:FkbM family methyltransferase